MKLHKTIGFLLMMVALAASPAGAWMTFSLDEPITELAGNASVDIVYDGTYVWFATGNGISGTADGGMTWRTYNEANGLDHSSISALAALDDRLWAATAYERPTGNSDTEYENYGGGVQYTDNFGTDWSLATPVQLANRGRLAWDMEVYDSSLWAAAWYGGLVRSFDGGDTWENIFIDDAVRQDFEDNAAPQLTQLFRGWYWTVVADPYHDDTTIVWAGSGEGVQRFYYIGKTKKLASNHINDVDHDSLFWWFATDRGLTRYEDTLFESPYRQISWTFVTYDSSNGFPGNDVSAVGSRQDLICAGIYDTLAESSLGLVVSTNHGASWTVRTPAQAVGSGHLIEEVKVLDGVIWAACNEGGLIYSADQGETWENLYVDQGRTESSDPRNIYHCLDLVRTEEFTRLLAGTDSGAVAYYYTDPPELDSAVYYNAWDTDEGGQRFVSITSLLDDQYDEIWVAALPQHDPDSETSSPPAVLRWQSDITNPEEWPWTAYLNSDRDFLPYDIDFFQLSSTVSLLVANNSGMYSTIDFGDVWSTVQFNDQFTGQRLIPDGTAITCVETGGGYVSVGSVDAGMARLFNPLQIWYTYQAQTDPLQFDFAGRSYISSAPDSNDIGGNWTRAMGLQRTGDSTIIWAATVPAPYGRYGVSITSDRGANWREVADGFDVWEMSFNGDSTYLACSQGLYFSEDFGENWERLTIYEPETGRSIDPADSVYSVLYADNALYVGAKDGVAISTDHVNWKIYRTFEVIDSTLAAEERSYVTPSPYIPRLDAGPMKFHYILEQGGQVTISIYDFANYLVREIKSDGVREAGVQYDDLDFWDGLNERGDVAAGGVYIYLITSTGGDELWGKFMVVP